VNCTPAQAQAQVQYLRPEESACPGLAWWPHFVAASLSCRPIVVVNVGANKGHSLASFAALFAPELGITPVTPEANF